jgi:hypothetical protein
LAYITSPGDLTNPHAPQAENDSLKNVKLNKFTVNPLKVAPYGTATATWDVTVGTVGSETFKRATQRESFALAAVINQRSEPRDQAGSRP